MNCSVAGSDSRMPCDRTVATRGIRCLSAWARRRGEAMGDAGEKIEKNLGNGKYLDFVGIHWVLLYAL